MTQSSTAMREDQAHITTAGLEASMGAIGKEVSTHTQKCLDLKALQHQPCPGNGINLPYNLQAGHSLSVFKQYHSWVLCCFQVELNSTTVTPPAKAGVGRDKKCRGDIFCFFPPQGHNPSNPPSSVFLSPAVLVPNLNPILRLAHPTRLAHSCLRWWSILILHILATDNHSFKQNYFCPSNKACRFLLEMTKHFNTTYLGNWQPQF